MREHESSSSFSYTERLISLNFDTQLLFLVDFEKKNHYFYLHFVSNIGLVQDINIKYHFLS